jgi:phosphoketolase
MNPTQSNNSVVAISAYGTARSTVKGAPLSPDELRKIDAYWRASLYLCLGMLYLKDNPLLREALKLEHTKPRLLGRWGSDAGQSFTYTHFNRLINKYDLNAIFISGLGHGAPAVLSQAYLEGAYSEVYPDKSEDIAGMRGYKPEELFSENGQLIPELKDLAPKGRRRMSANPVANGGLLRKALHLSDFRSSAVAVKKPGATLAGNVPTLGNEQIACKNHAYEFGIDREDITNWRWPYE